DVLDLDHGPVDGAGVDAVLAGGGGVAHGGARSFRGGRPGPSGRGAVRRYPVRRPGSAARSRECAPAGRGDPGRWRGQAGTPAPSSGAGDFSGAASMMASSREQEASRAEMCEAMAARAAESSSTISAQVGTGVSESPSKQCRTWAIRAVFRPAAIRVRIRATTVTSLSEYSR